MGEEGTLYLPTEESTPACMTRGSVYEERTAGTQEAAMGLMFDPREVFQIAVRIEENGERFYREMASRIDDEEVQGLFSFLADEEVRHQRFYRSG